MSKGILNIYIYFLFPICNWTAEVSFPADNVSCSSCFFMLCFFMLTSCTASLWLFKFILSISSYSQSCNSHPVSLSFVSKTGLALGYFETSNKGLFFGSFYFFVFKYGGFDPLILLHLEENCSTCCWCCSVFL